MMNFKLNLIVEILWCDWGRGLRLIERRNKCCFVFEWGIKKWKLMCMLVVEWMLFIIVSFIKVVFLEDLFVKIIWVCFFKDYFCL